jgi:diguanylate cyclase (GGDEF)-like protein
MCAQEARALDGLGNKIEIRVILVGKTGLDAALRLDPTLEVVRAGTPLEAVGEVSDPPLSSDFSAPRHVVILARQLEDELRKMPPEPGQMGPGGIVEAMWRGRAGKTGGAGGGARGIDPSDIRIIEFICGIKLADPHAVVMNMDGPSGTESSMFDATIPQGLTPADVQRLLHGALPLDAAESASEHVGLGAAGGASGPIEAGNTAPTPGDSAVLAELLRGGDVVGAAMTILRQRCADPTLMFVDDLTQADRPGSQPVVWESQSFGVLVATSVPAGVLSAHAKWLGGWLRLRAQHQQLRSAAFTDPLTGAWNRRYLDLFLKQAIDQAQALRSSVTVLLFDIDDFKRFNDSYGHDAGDDILREMVRLLGSVIRPTDRVCRIGGDEFAVIFHEPGGPRHAGSKPPSSVFEIAQRFQQQVLRHTFPKLANAAPGTLTISGGLATFPWDGTTPEAMLKRADELLLEGKKQGKNALTLGPGAMKMREGGD